MLANLGILYYNITTMCKSKTVSMQEQSLQAYEYLLALANFTVNFADVDRAPRYLDGDRETDVEHSFHLALSATELAAAYYPELDVGLVAQFSLVHDFPEVYAGDVWTFDISDEDSLKKELAEKEATERLLKELPPHTAQLLRRYEDQQEPEARFVRFVDKILPTIITIVATETSSFKEDHGVTSIDILTLAREKNTVKFQAMFPEFTLVHMVRDLVLQASEDRMFPPEN